MRIRLNTVKSKVLAGVAAVTLVSGAGLVAANTDAGTALQNWYDGAFGTAKVEMTKDVVKYGESKIGGLANEYNGLRNDATKSINTTKDTSKAGATSNINSAKDSHIKSINDKEAQLLASMTGEFDALSIFGKSLIDEAGKEALKYANNDLVKLTAKNGNDAFADLNAALSAEKEKAVGSLQSEIDSAKTELQKKLTTEKNLTAAELKAAIDAKINELRNVITQKKNELVAVQQGLITAEAQRLENVAKAEMDAIVAGINN